MLYLVQHAEAKPATEDPERDLTEAGVRHARQAGAFLASRGITVDLLWHSEKLRAEHTARIIAAEIGCTERRAAHRGMLPADDTAPLSAEIAAIEEKDVMLVGHLPFLDRLAAELLGSASSPVRFRNAGVVALSLSGGSWSVDWAVTPDLYRKES